MSNSSRSILQEQRMGEQIWKLISSPGKELFKAYVKFSHEGGLSLTDRIIAPGLIFPILKRVYENDFSSTDNGLDDIMSTQRKK